MRRGAWLETVLRPAANYAQVAATTGWATTVGLAAIEPLAEQLGGYHAYHATRADLLRRLGRVDDARDAYERAIELAGNTAERATLSRRRDGLEPSCSGSS